ncbi:hypothetical protein BDZ90DRAFT_233883 [Jaminaea rosea]|uniref:Uncharacterized protein n=1 Tax=Jaminaea rosea TaxID=1569628 RepID=A0A316UKV6_9BASI|nr:hypothetical protein BDZ90DRAFT_233883 [Jaminaea rosea]PWN25869.1 hypothetical protein BDZ90DRAFT_233883 [Jaminaea rosea]
MTPDMTTSGGAPPSYQSAVFNDAAAQQQGETGKADVDKADTKRGEGNEVTPSSTHAPVASSSQLCAPAGANTVEPKFGGPDHEYRKRDAELWPYLDPFLPIVAVYGLYIESDDLYAEPHTIKLTDFNGRILWHFLFPLCPLSHHLVLLKEVENKGTVWMVPGDQVIDNPRKGRKGPGRPWTKGAEPPAPEQYTWKRRLCGNHPLQCADGRKSDIAVNLHFEEHQVFSGVKKLRRRDSVEFTVPGSNRTFVWLCDGILRNNRYTRWDRMTYVLHEKGDYSTQYAYLRWQESFGLYLRQGLPQELDHALITFPLVYMMLMQHSICQTFWQQPMVVSDGSDMSQQLFSIKKLQKQAADFGFTP